MIKPHDCFFPMRTETSRFVTCCALSTLLLFAFSRTAVLAQDTPRQQLKKAMNKGLKLYRQKKYADSAKEFHQAIDINPQSSSAHWNLARALGMLLLTQKPCMQDAKQSVIIRHVFKACRLNPRLKRRLRKEKAFRSVHDTVAWQRLMGLRPNSTRTVGRILRNVSWYGPPSKEGGPSSGMDFRKGGKVLLWVKDESNELGRQSFQGRWSTKRNLIFVDLKTPFNEKTHFEGELRQTGELWLPGLPAPFTDDRHECTKQARRKNLPAKSD